MAKATTPLTMSGTDESGKSMERVYKDIKALTDFVAYRYENGNKRHVDMKRFILYTSWQKGGNEEVTIAVDAEFLFRCKETAMLVRWREIQKLKSPAAKALLFYLDCNNMYENMEFSEHGIMKMLGVPAVDRKLIETKEQHKKRLEIAKELRKKIKNAFEMFIKRKLITGWEYKDKEGKYLVLRNTVYRDKKKRNQKQLQARQVESAFNDTPMYDNDALF